MTKPNEFIFVSKEEAERVLKQLNDIVDEFAAVSRADLYELLGLPSTYEDNKTGWTDLKGVKIRRVTSYSLDLPPREGITM